ncbi:MAG: hydroxyacylglutathione hydrolase [Maribacter sp.]|jgi:hydroxyacylglutathione hydrolase
MKIQYQSKNLVIFESSLFRTTTTLIISEKYILLVDPNWLPIEIEFIEKYIYEIIGNKEQYLLFTHSDYDHIIGYKKFKNYTTIASANFVNNKEKEDVLNQINKFDDEYYISRDYKIEYPEINKRIKGNNELLNIESDEYVFYQATGHNKDGLIIYNKSKQILIVGDYLSNIEFPYIYDSVKNYKETLLKLEKIINTLPIKILITGHGDYTSDKKEMKNRIVESRNYIEELENSIIHQREFDVSKIYPRYKFPIIMNQFHQNNIKLATKELKVLW